MRVSPSWKTISCQLGWQKRQASGTMRVPASFRSTALQQRTFRHATPSGAAGMLRRPYMFANQANASRTCPCQSAIAARRMGSRRIQTRQQSTMPRNNGGRPGGRRGVVVRRHKASLAAGNSTTNNAANTVPTTAASSQSFSFWHAVEAVLRKPRTLPVPRWISPSHTTITVSELLGHSSFLLVAVSYAVDDFLWLRILAVAGSTTMLFFAYFHPHGRVLWLPFKWNVAFILINGYRIGRVYWERYMADQLPAEHLELRKNNFYSMDPVDFAKLMRMGTVKHYNQGDLVTFQGESNQYVRLVLDGDLKVLRNGQLTYVLGPANFVSEAGLHAGLLLSGPVESCCSIVAESPVIMISWDRTQLVDLMKHDESMRRQLKAVLSWDIVRKLKSQRALLASGRITDVEAWTRLRNEQTHHRYAAILHNLLSHNHTKDLRHYRRQELNKYRHIHNVDDAHHNAALRDVGWTPDEFEKGHKDDDGHFHYAYAHDDGRDQEGLAWYLADLKYRIFGWN